ncbi:MAG: SIMPL domain-containing protein [Sulfurospirillum sp.]|nr:SIMPL domain-containing protein [Sulfurospirillum sp.]MBP9613234.1 SIMPL domain-containing protein [Sulfurospirillum sp.]
MKRRYILALLCLPLITCAQMSITTLESASQTVPPDTLRATFHFTEENKNTNVIKEHLNAIITQVKQWDSKSNTCTGGGYHLSPRYTYKEQKQTFIGYSGTLSFSCAFNDIEAYNTLLGKIESVKASAVLSDYGALFWEVSPKVLQNTRLAMRSSLLRIAQEQASYFSNETQKQCHVSAMTFEDAHINRPPLMQSMARSTGAMKVASEPIQEPLHVDEVLRLSATVTYTCSDK